MRWPPHTRPGGGGAQWQHRAAAAERRPVCAFERWRLRLLRARVGVPSSRQRPQRACARADAARTMPGALKDADDNLRKAHETINAGERKPRPSSGGRKPKAAPDKGGGAGAVGGGKEGKDGRREGEGSRTAAQKAALQAAAAASSYARAPGSRAADQPSVLIGGSADVGLNLAELGSDASSGAGGQLRSGRVAEATEQALNLARARELDPALLSLEHRDGWIRFARTAIPPAPPGSEDTAVGRVGELGRSREEQLKAKLNEEMALVEGRIKHGAEHALKQVRGRRPRAARGRRGARVARGAAGAAGVARRSLCAARWHCRAPAPARAASRAAEPAVPLSRACRARAPSATRTHPLTRTHARTRTARGRGRGGRRASGACRRATARASRRRTRVRACRRRAAWLALRRRALSRVRAPPPPADWHTRSKPAPPLAAPTPPPRPPRRRAARPLARHAGRKRKLPRGVADAHAQRRAAQAHTAAQGAKKEGSLAPKRELLDLLRAFKEEQAHQEVRGTRRAWQRNAHGLDSARPLGRHAMGSGMDRENASSLRPARRAGARPRACARRHFVWAWGRGCV